MGSNYCCGLHPKASVIVIAIVDIILSLILFLLCQISLANLHKVSKFIERDALDRFNLEIEANEIPTTYGINEYKNLHGEIVLGIFGTLVSFLLAVGLLFGVQKEFEIFVKSWLIYSCTLVLLGVISLLVVIILTAELIFSIFFILVAVRIYEIWVVFDYLRNSKFTHVSLSRTDSSERLHSV